MVPFFMSDSIAMHFPINGLVSSGFHTAFDHFSREIYFQERRQLAFYTLVKLFPTTQGFSVITSFRAARCVSNRPSSPFYRDIYQEKPELNHQNGLACYTLVPRTGGLVPPPHIGPGWVPMIQSPYFGYCPCDKSPIRKMEFSIVKHRENALSNREIHITRNIAP
jgi:hypothetical protein